MDPTVLQTFNVTKGELLCATPYYSDAYVAAGSSNRTVMLFPTNQTHRYRRLDGHSGPVTCLSVSTNPECLASGSEDGTVRLWRIQGNDESCHKLEPSDKPIKSIDLAPNADRLLLSAVGAKAAFWDTFLKSEIQTFDNQQERVNSVALDMENSLAIMGTDEARIRIFDIRSGELTTRPIETTTGVQSISLAAEAGLLGVGTEGGTVLICSVQNGYVVKSSKLHKGPVNAISLQPRGNYVLTGGDDHNVVLADLSSLEPAFTLTAHKERVIDARFSLSGEFFSTCSADSRLVYWASPNPQKEEAEVVPEEEAPVPKKPPVPEPEIGDASSIASSRKSHASSKKSVREETLPELPKQARGLSELDDSSDDSSELTPPPKRRRMRTFVSSLRAGPTPRKSSSPEDQEQLDLILEASHAIDAIGKRLVDLGIKMKLQDQKIQQLEALPGSALVPSRSRKRNGK
jgi:WD40 repeat protein